MLIQKDDNSTVKTDIAILGGGFAGLSCAKELKRLNPNLDVTIIEKKSLLPLALFLIFG